LTHLDLFTDWVGKTRNAIDDVSAGAIRRLAATLDREPEPFTHGVAVPEGWHAILFGPETRQSQLAPDGLAGADASILPSRSDLQRLFAGRRTTFHLPIHIGDQVERQSTILSVESKIGKTGPFTLLTVRHELMTQSSLAIAEDWDFIYRTITETAAQPAAEASRKPEALQALWSQSWKPDPVLLFRYSALTFNAHRIHFDWPYAHDKEGYPALLVSGDLTALALLEAARPHLGPIGGCEARAIRPIFVGDPVELCGRVDGDQAVLWAAVTGSPRYQVKVTLSG
jgi:3-methylfumaryl-CoA hydratase